MLRMSEGAMQKRCQRRRSIAAPRSCACTNLALLLPWLQGYIDAGLVDYQHFSQFEHASGKPQMFAYDE